MANEDKKKALDAAIAKLEKDFGKEMCIRDSRPDSVRVCKDYYRNTCVDTRGG